MTEDPKDVDDDPMPPEVPFSGDFLTAVLSDREDLVERFHDVEGVNWWNVSLTLAYLIKRSFSGDAATLRIIADCFSEAERVRQEAPSERR
jgi:hypothetical protein